MLARMTRITRDLADSLYMYDSQIVHHNPCFNLFKLHNNSFDNQGSKINKSDIFI